MGENNLENLFIFYKYFENQMGFFVKPNFSFWGNVSLGL
jgi:hypothetical protein